MKGGARVEATGKRNADLLAGRNALKDRHHLAANDINGRGGWQIMTPRMTRRLPFIVAAIGVLIVVYQWANARPLWLDEEMIALNFRDRPFAGLGGRLWLDQSAPLGWLALQRFVLLTFGPSELAVRALPAAFGVATVIAALYVGQRWLTTAGSTVLVLLCSLGQWISFHAVELKPVPRPTRFGG